MVWLHCPGCQSPNWKMISVVCVLISLSIISISSQCELHRGHQDPAEQGGFDANTSQHEHIHRVEAGGGVQEHIPRGHRSDISGTGATWS